MTRQQFISHVESSQKAFRSFLVALCCGDSALADDIAQESYIKAYLSAGDFSDESKFNAWLRKIGLNTFLNHKRIKTANAEYIEASDLEAPQKTDSVFQYQDLYRALDRLPEQERISILLFYMEGYSAKEIAEMTGATHDAVKQHLSRGRNHLRGLLG